MTEVDLHKFSHIFFQLSAAKIEKITKDKWLIFKIKAEMGFWLKTVQKIINSAAHQI